MKSLPPAEICPRCGVPALKSWPALTEDEKFLAERLPASAEYPREHRKRHRYCTRCWFEETENISKLA